VSRRGGIHIAPAAAPQWRDYKSEDAWCKRQLKRRRLAKSAIGAKK
jgi:hypothetical protein